MLWPDRKTLVATTSRTGQIPIRTKLAPNSHAQLRLYRYMRNREFSLPCQGHRSIARLFPSNENLLYILEPTNAWSIGNRKTLPWIDEATKTTKPGWSGDAISYSRGHSWLHHYQCPLADQLATCWSESFACIVSQSVGFVLGSVNHCSHGMWCLESRCNYLNTQYHSSVHESGQTGNDIGISKNCPSLTGRAPGSWLQEPGFESCAAVLKPRASVFHSTLLQFTQLYKWVPGYRQWWICVRVVFAH